MNLADAFVGLAHRWPERPALISPALSLTYAGLAARATQTARELRLRGVKPGANIGIGIRNNAETLIAMIALWMLGATAVPLDFRATAAERKLLAVEFDLFAIIEDRRFPDSGYETIFMDGSWADQIGRHDASPLANEAEDAPALIGLAQSVLCLAGTTGFTSKPETVGRPLTCARKLDHRDRHVNTPNRPSNSRPTLTANGHLPAR